MGRLFAFVLRLVPASWRASVRMDIEEDARAQGRGSLWKSWQAARVAARWRWTFGGEAFMSDLRYSVRSLAAARWFSTAAVLTFAIGIGVNIAVFSAIDRLFFRELPYSDPNQLVLLRWCNPKTGDCTQGSFPSPVAYALQQRSATLSGIAVAGRPSSYTTGQGGEGEALALYDVSPGTLRLLGVRPVIGRDITDEEIASKSAVAWISEEAWRSRLNSDAGIVGRPLWQTGKQVAIIGILPKGFIPPSWSSVDSRWAGLVVGYNSWSTIQPLGSMLAPFGRLRPGVTLAAVQQEVGAVLDGLPNEQRRSIKVDWLQGNLFSRFRQYLWLVIGAAALVLLMACANLASLFLARGRSRERLSAIATALGASRWRVLRTSMIECGVVCLMGCAVATAALVTAGQVLTAALPPLLGRYAVPATDLRILGFALLASTLAAIVAGVVPGWRATKVDVLSVLQKGTQASGRRPARSTRGLLVAETAIGCLLVLASVLAVRSFALLSSDELGFLPQGLSLVSVQGRGRVTPDEQRQRIEAAVEVVESIPGVLAAGAADTIPTSGATALHAFKSEGKLGDIVQVTAGYFPTLSTEFVAGRAFTPDEVRTRTEVVILNELAVSLLFPGASPAAVVGRTWQADGEAIRQIIGVTENIKSAYGDEKTRPTAFVPIGTKPAAWDVLIARVASGAPLRADALRDRLRGRLGDITVSVSDVSTRLDTVLQDPRFRALLLTMLALSGLVVTVVGLYGVASYDVAQRVHEIGVRLSLGASRRALTFQILRHACAPVVLGAAIGLAGAYWMAGFAQTFLYKLDGRDPLTYAAVAGVMIATSVVAAWLPARRAAATDPAIVLKAQ